MTLIHDVKGRTVLAVDTFGTSSVYDKISETIKDDKQKLNYLCIGYVKYTRV